MTISFSGLSIEKKYITRKKFNPNPKTEWHRIVYESDTSVIPISSDIKFRKWMDENIDCRYSYSFSNAIDGGGGYIAIHTFYFEDSSEAAKFKLMDGFQTICNIYNDIFG